MWKVLEMEDWEVLQEDRQSQLHFDQSPLPLQTLKQPYRTHFRGAPAEKYPKSLTEHDPEDLDSLPAQLEEAARPTGAGLGSGKLARAGRKQNCPTLTMSPYVPPSPPGSAPSCRWPGSGPPGSKALEVSTALVSDPLWSGQLLHVGVWGWKEARPEQELQAASSEPEPDRMTERLSPGQLADEDERDTSLTPCSPRHGQGRGTTVGSLRACPVGLGQAP